MCVLSHFSHVWLFAILWTVACQAPLSMEFSRQEYWSALPCPPPGDLPYPGIKPTPSVAPALQADIYIYIYIDIYIYIYLQLSHWGSLCFGIQLTKHAITYLWVLGKRKNNVLHSYQGRMLNLIVKIWKAFQKRCKVKAIEWVGVTQEKPEDSASDRERAWLSQEKKVIPHEWIRECVCFVGGGGVGRQGGKQ